MSSYFVKDKLYLKLLKRFLLKRLKKMAETTTPDPENYMTELNLNRMRLSHKRFKEKKSRLRRGEKILEERNASRLLFFHLPYILLLLLLALIMHAFQSTLQLAVELIEPQRSVSDGSPPYNPSVVLLRALGSNGKEVCCRTLQYWCHAWRAKSSQEFLICLIEDCIRHLLWTSGAEETDQPRKIRSESDEETHDKSS